MWPKFKSRQLLDIAKAMVATVLRTSLEEGGLNVASCGECMNSTAGLAKHAAEYILDAAERKVVPDLDMSQQVTPELCKRAAWQVPAIVVLRWIGGISEEVLSKHLQAFWEMGTWAHKEAGVACVEEVSISQLSYVLHQGEDGGVGGRAVRVTACDCCCKLKLPLRVAAGS